MTNCWIYISPLLKDGTSKPGPKIYILVHFVWWLLRFIFTWRSTSIHRRMLCNCPRIWCENIKCALSSSIQSCCQRSCHLYEIWHLESNHTRPPEQLSWMIYRLQNVRPSPYLLSQGVVQNTQTRSAIQIFEQNMETHSAACSLPYISLPLTSSPR